MRSAAGPRRGSEQQGTLDVNRERLVYCCLSLVGHRVTVKLRSNTYEGLFHSCALDGDNSVTLRYARQPPQGETLSGEVINSLIIPWKDILQVSASGVSPPYQETTRFKRGSFQIDTEISGGADTNVGRELVPWLGENATAHDSGALDTTSHREGAWDQFVANSERYGIMSTYDEELYTTKLDPNRISQEKREKAERIAKEIESGIQHADAEERCLGGEQDEEAKFSSVPRSRSGKDSMNESAGGASSLLARVTRSNTEPFPKAALTTDNLTRHDIGVGGCGDGFALEHRTKRGMITANLPMRPPMVSEMKRINALNLEPALPKLDDKTRTDWINFKQQQTRNPTKFVHGSSLKNEFEQSLMVIQQREASKVRADQAPSGAMSSGSELPACGDTLSTRSKFAFNPAAKEFSFNAGAAVFTPSAGGAQASTPMESQPTSIPQASIARSPAAVAERPTFAAPRQAGRGPARTLIDILDGVYERARGERTESVKSTWPEAEGGPMFREVLGRPNPSVGHQQSLPGSGPATPCQGGCMIQAWSKLASAQVGPGGAGAGAQGPQMMGYIVSSPGGPGASMQQQAVYNPQSMIMGLSGQQRPQGCAQVAPGNQMSATPKYSAQQTPSSISEQGEQS